MGKKIPKKLVKKAEVFLSSEKDRLEKSIASQKARFDCSDYSGRSLSDLADRNQYLDRYHDTLEETEKELADVIGALSRIKNGTWGICIDCGKTIPEPRLEAYPTAKTCVDCRRRRQTARQKSVAAPVMSPA
jgi:DnaK suppressor protein